MTKQKRPGIFNWNKIEIARLEYSKWSLKPEYLVVKCFWSSEIYIQKKTWCFGKIRLKYIVNDPSKHYH